MLKPKLTLAALNCREAFREALIGWFSNHGMDYRWRRTREPYAILISEVMLQQTQIATVLGRGFYTRFLETFPDVRRGLRRSQSHITDIGDDSFRSSRMKGWVDCGGCRMTVFSTDREISGGVTAIQDSRKSA